ncbi:MAG: biotin transporter BioY [Eubacteriales bacterium]|nr:biotin transporter BioY [Eubacteriales bacterium]
MQTAATKHTPVTTRQMALIGVMTAVTCIAAPFSIPIPVSPVPLSLTTMVLYLAIYVLGTKNAFISYVIYLLLGLVGLPVFSGFSGGPGKLAGPTGGYLIGFLFMIPLTGILFEKCGKSILRQIGAMALGTLVCYLFGTVWLCLSLHLSFFGGLGVGVLPYLPGDAVKIILAAFLGQAVLKALKRTNL